MPDIEKQTKNFIVRSRKANIVFTGVSTNGATAILSSFGYDPLECPNCKHENGALELYYNHKRVSLEELYERAMSKSFGKRSSA
ncbi:MAG: hypothetical protein ACLROG_03945 [Coprococcus phoceensis]